MNGLLIGENMTPAALSKIPGAPEFLSRYTARAAAAGIDPLGFAWGPFAYSAGQVLAQAVTETKSLDHSKLADYMHKASFDTVAGSFSFASDGEWSRSSQIWTQFQNVQPTNLDQFKTGQVQPILWPADMKTGNLIYPYGNARKK
jgi:branched-chain amino acid transport system substrate-binding protein